MFREEDDALLPRQEEEGVQIEPKHFLPILPTVLVNGATGIGTGGSTTICNHNPVEVVDRLTAKSDLNTVTVDWVLNCIGSWKLL